MRSQGDGWSHSMGEDFTPALSVQLVQDKVQRPDMTDWQQNRIVLGSLCNSAVAEFWQRKQGQSLAHEQSVTRLVSSPTVDLFLCAMRKQCPSSTLGGLHQTPGKGAALISPLLTSGVNSRHLLCSSHPFSHPLIERCRCV